MKARHWILGGVAAKLAITVAIVGAVWYFSRKPYAGQVATGWGGNRAGNLPTVQDAKVIVGTFGGKGAIYGPPNAATGANPNLGELP